MRDWKEASAEIDLNGLQNDQILTSEEILSDLDSDRLAESFLSVHLSRRDLFRLALASTVSLPFLGGFASAAQPSNGKSQSNLIARLIRAPGRNVVESEEIFSDGNFSERSAKLKAWFADKRAIEVQLFSRSNSIGAIRQELIQDISLPDNKLEILIGIPYIHEDKRPLLIRLSSPTELQRNWGVNWAPFPNGLKKIDDTLFRLFFDYKQYGFFSKDPEIILPKMELFGDIHPVDKECDAKWLCSIKGLGLDSDTRQFRAQGLVPSRHVLAAKLLSENDIESDAALSISNIALLSIPYGEKDGQRALLLSFVPASKTTNRDVRWTTLHSLENWRLDLGAKPVPIYLQFFALGGELGGSSQFDSAHRNGLPKASNPTWHTLAQVPNWKKESSSWWNPIPCVYKQGRSQSSPSPAAMILEVWNAVVNRTYQGTIHHAGRPFSPLPEIFSKDLNSTVEHSLLPAFHYVSDVGEGMPADPKIAKIEFHTTSPGNNTKLSASLQFHLSGSKGTSEVVPTASIDSFEPAFDGEVQPEMAKAWSAVPIDKKNPSFPISVAMGYAQHLLSTPAEDTVVEFKIENIDFSKPLRGKNAESEWRRFGSLEIKPSSSRNGNETAEQKKEKKSASKPNECIVNKKPEDSIGKSNKALSEKGSATFKLRGRWDTEVCDLYPEMDLTINGCDIRFSSTDDPPDVELTTILDVRNELEDALQRESSALIFDNGCAIAENADVRVRTRTDPGRNPITVVTVNNTVKTTYDKPNRFYLNMKPFTVAYLHPPEIEASATAEPWQWSSNDPEGPQWRIGSPTIKFEFPPQAVGEEMERGRRFWPNQNKSYINPEQPIRYRFSPPTTLTVRPSVVERRYNKSAANLREILRGAEVDHLKTEVMYPIEIEFNRDANGFPDVRISEVGEFFGQPAINLEISPESNSRTAKNYETKRYLDHLYYAGIKRWLFRQGDQPDNILSNVISDIATVREKQAAIRASFVSRLGVFQLYDPFKRGRQLLLTEGLDFRIRDYETGGAPPLINPLPTDSLPLDDKTLKAIETFCLTKKDGETGFIENDCKTPKEEDNAIRAGIIHTFEFASEMRAVLENPTSKRGIVESLSLSALGASGTVEAAFDEGRTTFTAKANYGQLSRLVKTRIGRIGVVWNIAKHVVVYERTTTTSRQFNEQQTIEKDMSSQDASCILDTESPVGKTRNDPLQGWPVLRKTEEYIEIIESIREFSEEEGANKKKCGPVGASCFPSKRIYVDGAWGKDLGGTGYEIPLWNLNVDHSLYPKPTHYLEGFASADERVRNYHKRPQALYFYSNAEQGAGANPNKWPPRERVDFLNCENFGVVHVQPDQNKVLDGDFVQPGTTSFLPDRFNFCVQPEGPVNLQHERGETVMLAKIDQFFLSRSSFTGPPTGEQKYQLDPPKGEDELYLWLEQVVPRTLKALAQQPIINVAKCSELLEKTKSELLTDLQNRLDKDYDWRNTDANTTIDQLTEDAKAILAAARFLLKAQVVLLRTGVDDYKAAPERANQAIESILKEQRRDFEFRGEKLQKSIKQIEKNLKKASAELSGAGDKIKEIVDNKIDAEKLESALGEAGTKLADAKGKLLAISEPKFAAFKERLARIVDFMAGQITLAKALKARAKNKVDAGALQNLTTPLGNCCLTLSIFVQQISSAFDNFKLPSPDFNQVDELIKCDDSIFFREAETILGKKDTDEGTLLKTFDDEAMKVTQYWNELKVTFGETSTTAFANVDKVVKQSREFVKEVVNRIIDAAFGDAKVSCENFTSGANEAAKQIDGWISDRKKEIDRSVAALANSEFARQLERRSGETASVVDKGNKLIRLGRMVGELPSMPNLTFNATRCEYVLDDFKSQIETSPFAAKLREIDKGLKELGLALPCNQLLDQLVPMPLKDLDASQIFKNLGGFEWGKKLFNFKLPALGNDNIKITQGVDKQTRSAWIKSRVDANFGRQKAFEIGPVELVIDSMNVFADSDVSIDTTGMRRAVTKSRMSGDWKLNISGKELVKIRDVNVHFDGNAGFRLDVSLDKVEFDPSIKFVSDIANQFGEKIPPNIKVERDENGMPAGLTASFLTSVPQLPPLGTLKIGPFDIATGLGLRSKNGKFEILTNFSLGTRTKPVFVEVNKLGGGFFIQCSVLYPPDGKAELTAYLGFAVGSLETINFAGIARGSYTLLLYAYLSANAKNGTSLAVGLTIAGSARILGMANASVSMLLEARQEAGGDMKGYGRLDVEIEICWCYTLRVHEAVEHKL